MADDPQNVSDAQIDEWFLEAVSADPLPLTAIMAVLTNFYSSSRILKADSLAELAQETLKARHDVSGVLTICELQAEWMADEPAFRQRCRSLLQESYAQPHLGTAFVDAAGFAKNDVAAQECLRRLRLLLRLEPGVLCLDRTWGFGIVKSMDTFYKKVAIDFEKKHDHELGFEYAASVLTLLDDNHILVMKHRDPDKLQQLVRSSPAEIVKILIRCYGPLNVAQIQELLVPGIFAAADWKTFWDGARKALKTDKLVAFPISRLDQISLLHTEKAFDDAWLDKLSRECNLDTILTAVGNYADETDPAASTDKEKEVLLDRLLHVVKGASNAQLVLSAKGLMMLKQLAIPVDPGIAAAYIDCLLSRTGLLKVASELPASGLEPLLEYLMDQDQTRTATLLLSVLSEASITPLNTITDFLCTRGLENETIDVFKKSMAAGTSSIEMLLWLSKRVDLMRSRSIGTVADFLTQCITRLQDPLHGERLKAGKQLRALFERTDWLAPVLAAVLPGERQRFVMMMKDARGWAALERNAVLARAIGLYPELHQLLLSDEDKALERRSAGRYTSWRSYGERRARLEQIIDGDLPQNGKDLALARSYGDLSENHAFKAAKERQNMLVNQRDTIARELKEVKGTAFDGFASDAAGMGTRVVFSRADGTTVEKFILGEWDTDEKQSIISNKTTLATALAGHKKGETVQIPGETGTESCRILEVEPLPGRLIEWARGDAMQHSTG